jgi:DNA-binding response OmpR family regulator
MMPIIDGYEACRILKANPLTKNIPVILLTAKGRDIDRRLGYEVGATDYIIKPFSPNKLIDRIHKLLSCAK